MLKQVCNSEALPICATLSRSITSGHVWPGGLCHREERLVDVMCSPRCSGSSGPWHRRRAALRSSTLARGRSHQPPSCTLCSPCSEGSSGSLSSRTSSCGVPGSPSGPSPGSSSGPSSGPSSEASSGNPVASSPQPAFPTRSHGSRGACRPGPPASALAAALRDSLGLP